MSESAQGGSVLGVIPARGGSKGLPGKNIRKLIGKPLIAYTIEACQAARRLTHFIVSTDSPEIAQVAENCGAEVPFLRPAEFATDSAQSIPMMQHALQRVEELEAGRRYDYVAMFQPTSPFKTSIDIDNALAVLSDTGADSVISVKDVEGYRPERMKFLRDGRLIDPPYCEKVENQPRQELVPVYIRNGAIYACRREVLLSGSFKGSDCRAYVMSSERSINIDTESDFLLAEFLLSK